MLVFGVEFENSKEPRSPPYATFNLPHPERSLALKAEKAPCQGPLAEGVSPLTDDHTGMAQEPPGLPRVPFYSYYPHPWDSG